MVEDSLLIDGRRWRLKNKTIPRARDKSSKSCEVHDERKVIGDVLCPAFELSAFLLLFPYELAKLEASCHALRGSLVGDNAHLIWSASVYATLRGRRLLLPVQRFAGMTVPQIKSLVGCMEFARGPLNRLTSLGPGSEFDLVSSACSEFNPVGKDVSCIRVIAGHMRFFQRSIRSINCFVEDEEAEATLCSDEMQFLWPSIGSHGKGTMIAASLMFLPGCNAFLIKISNMIKPSRDTLALSVDVHVASPLWPQDMKAEGLKLRVDGSGTYNVFHILESDTSKDEVEQTLMAPDGVLCVFVVRSSP